MKFHKVYVNNDGSLNAGEAVFGASPTLDNLENDMTYEDFGLDLVDDDLGAMDYASLGEMDYASLGEDGYDDFGRVRAKRNRQTNRRYRPRRPNRITRPLNAARPPAQQVVQKTLLVASSALNPGANFTLTIRPQFDFVAEDLTLTAADGAANAAGFGIQAIEFGDRIIFNNAQSVPLAVFGTGSFVRGLVKGAAIAAGLDISLSGTATGGTTTSQLTAVFTGLKRGTTGCGPGAV